MHKLCTFRQSWLTLVVAAYLHLARISSAEDHSVAYKYQLYSEDSGRMEIPSHYFQLETSLPYDITFSAKVLTNIMTGATPTGLLDPNDPTELELTEIDDQRWAYVFDITKEFGDHSFTFEYARSEEEDYISDGFSLRSEHQFNQQNTSLQLGVSFNDDLVTAATLFGDDQGKETLDIGIGLTQLLTKKTILQGNFTFGYSRGYLGDPYKNISRAETFEIPGFPVFTENVPYFENRPDERVRFVFRLGLVHYFESLNASLNSSYRFFNDDRDIRAHTLFLEWNQKIGDQIILSPYYRYYHQSEADYYYPNLDNVNIEPNDDRTGRAPFYSADYRLASFDAHTFGLKLIYNPTDWLSLDVGYERYGMYGNDSKTRASAFPKAHVLNIGAKARF